MKKNYTFEDYKKISDKIPNYALSAIEYSGDKPNSIFYLLGINLYSEYLQKYIEVLNQYICVKCESEGRFFPGVEVKNEQKLYEFKKEIEKQQGDWVIDQSIDLNMGKLEQINKQLAISCSSDFVLLTGILWMHIASCKRALETNEYDRLMGVVTDSPLFLFNELKRMNLLKDN